MAWTAEESVNKIYVRGEVVKEVSGEITAETVKEVAREQGIRQFNVRDYNTNDLLDEVDFPYDGSVVIEEVNAPK